ncbi:UNVERIFIED_CONTAM: putative E3 ubiquitin-protein ligase ZFP1 [Sesamum radiatum]|uniref:RING-type E3 ubiquitin transferase n=1 Tax=Sesamum radiatum TaxID=300843 RepID=A0AAW2K4E7_SESRA
MGHRNTQFTGHMIDMETDQQGHSHLHPEPCIFYRSAANFPQPNIHSVVPAQGNQCNFNFHHMPERHDNGLFYGVPHLNSVQPQHPATNLELAVAAPSGHYNPYLAPPSGIRDFPVQVNHGANDQLSLSSTHRFVGIPTDSYGRSLPYMDTIRGSFKRKNAEGFPGSYVYHNASAGPSSSIAPVTATPAESDITLTDAASFLPPEYGGDNLTPVVESSSHRSVRNRPGMIGPESIVAHNATHLIQGTYVAPPVQLPGNPWLDMHLGANNGEIGHFAWPHAPLPYMHANGACAEAGNISLNGYQVSGSNRSSSGFLHPHHQSHPNPHQPPPPMQGVRGYNVNVPSQLANSSRRISTISSSNTVITPYQDVVDARPTFLAPVPPTGASCIGEQIGNVGTGLSEEFIRNNLKIRTFTSITADLNLEDDACLDQQIHFCVICQTDYEDGEDIGVLDCGHEYHKECIKKWLLEKNTCAVCKSTALSHKAKDL